MIQKSRIFNPGADYEGVANCKSAAPKEGLSDLIWTFGSEKIAAKDQFQWHTKTW